MKTFSIRVSDDVRVVAAADLESMTSYVLLELEDWFEEEIAFVRTLVEPGMRMLDIGANHGVYALAAAARIGDAGHVWAFEPASYPRSMLQASIGENGFEGRVTVVPCALSNRAGTAEMSISSAQSEANSLHCRPGEVENVRLDTLDSAWQSLGSPPIDFVKIDAEGEEHGILQAGTRFFGENQPLVMFEVKSGSSHDDTLPPAFLALGYDLYRLVPGLGILAPFAPGDDLDPFQLNLFACKPERARSLAGRGLLATGPEGGALSGPLPDVRAVLAALPFSNALVAGWRAAPTDVAVSCFLGSQEACRPAVERLALLQQSLSGLEEALREEEHPAVRLSYLRVLRACGRRWTARTAMEPLVAGGVVVGGQALAGVLDRVFVPPLPEWDRRSTGDDAGAWNASAWGAALLADTMAGNRHYSTYFEQQCISALWDVRANAYTTVAMYRRLFLMFLRARRRIGFTNSDYDLFLRETAEHRNPAIWRELLAG